MDTPVLVLYAPAFHRGYDQLFQLAKELGVERVYLLGPELIKDFPLLEREIRQVDPMNMAKAIHGLGHFSEVTVVSASELEELGRSKNPVILSEEHISDLLAARFFVDNPVQRLPVFLRWDQKQVAAAVGEATYDTQVTTELFHQTVMQRAMLEAQLSSDWFRQVGAALVLDGTVWATTHNTRQPSPHEPWAVGDPRLYMEYGKTDPHRKVTTHAEELLLVACAREGVSTKGGWIYATTFPCPSCAALIGIAGINRCYFSSGYADLQGDKILASAGVAMIRVA